jgi:transposase
VGQARHLGENIFDAGEVLGPPREATDRLDNRQDAPQCRRRKRGAQHQAIGRSVGGRTTKIHLVTDAAGRPRVIQLTPGNTNDHKPAQHCLEQMPPARYVIADKGYDSAPLRQWLDQLGCQAVIPPRRNRKVLYPCDPSLYRERNIIERTINRFKDWRRIATRFDRYAFVFLAALSIVAVVTWWI